MAKRLPTQEQVPCGRTHDHEEHTWYTAKNKWCAGVVGGPSIPVEVETRPIPAWAADPQPVQKAVHDCPSCVCAP